MSSQNITDIAAALIQQEQDLYTESYLTFAAAVVLAFDYAHLGREIDFFWMRPFSSATALFLLNRYSFLLWPLLTFIGYHAFTDELMRLTMAVLCVHGIPTALFSAMRTLALSGSRVLAVLVFVLSIVGVAFNFATFSQPYFGVSDPQWGCLTDTGTFPESFLISLSGVCYLVHFDRRGLHPGGSYVEDAVFPREWAWGFSRSEGQPRMFADILVWNGTLYFVALLILNILHMSFTLAAQLTFSQGSFFTVFTDPSVLLSAVGRSIASDALLTNHMSNRLTGILVSRFLLDLQEAHQQTMKLAPGDPLRSTLSDCEFGFGGSRPAGAVSALGSIGADLGQMGRVHDASDDE
ncbi:uncharacterized protein BXZ73DRAFT_107024 [Epithele typhae]|uniref:uncharacterized protein n=1 Tax=Epithele typhae TaxID=378194 RepID=UPI0020072ABD|nr:uncharacterized protein BXZ73DRAFT_107024 [Epithele typhae]KAH9913147.1 hypothetical protein BXZ73DRAFT_107024 [Epithele typhae]